MKYAIVGNSGRQVQTYTDKSKAEAVLEGLKDTGAVLRVLAEASPRGIRNKGKVKSYRAKTLEKILAIIKRGQEKPRYAIHVNGVLLAYAPTEETANFLCRKARGFGRRFLQRKFTFRIEALSRPLRNAIG